MADLLKEELEKCDFTVIVSTKPDDALRKIEKQMPAVVLMDMLFHFNFKFDYEGMIRQIKAVSPKTQIVITTAIDEELHIQKAFNAGAVRHVPKCCLDELKRVLEETVEGKSADPTWGWEISDR